MRMFPRKYGNQEAIPFHQAEYIKLKKAIVDECRAIDFKPSRLMDCINGEQLLRLMATIELMVDGNKEINGIVNQQSAGIDQLTDEKFTLQQILATVCKQFGGRLELERIPIAYIEGLGKRFEFRKSIHPGTGVVTITLQEGVVVPGPGNNGHSPKAPPRGRPGP